MWAIPQVGGKGQKLRFLLWVSFEEPGSCLRGRRCKKLVRWFHGKLVWFLNVSKPVSPRYPHENKMCPIDKVPNIRQVLGNSKVLQTPENICSMKQHNLQMWIYASTNSNWDFHYLAILKNSLKPKTLHRQFRWCSVQDHSYCTGRQELS